MSVFGIPIAPSQICIVPKEASKEDALNALVDAAGSNPAITNRDALRAGIFDREAKLSTGLGAGVAIPHVRLSDVSAPVLAVGIAPDGVAFDAADGQPVHIMVLFATPKGADKEYLKLLAQVMLSLRGEEFFDRLGACRTVDEVFALLNA